MAQQPVGDALARHHTLEMTTQCQHDGHITQLQFNHAAKAFAQAWRTALHQDAYLSKLPSSSSTSRPHIAHSVLQSTWNVITTKDPFTHQEVVYLAMPQLLHAGPAADQPLEPQHTHQLTPDDQQAYEGDAWPDVMPGQQQAHGDTALQQHDDGAADVARADVRSDHSLGRPGLHLYDLHVVWHPSYQVPTLLLKACCTDGRPLSWTSIEADFPHWEGLRRQLGPGSWAFVTPLEQGHPVQHKATASQHWLMLHPCNTHAIMQLLYNCSRLDVAHGQCLGMDTQRLKCDQSEVQKCEECDVSDADSVNDMVVNDVDGFESEGVRDAGSEGWSEGCVTGVSEALMAGTAILHSMDVQRTIDDGYLAAWLAAVAGPVLQLTLDPVAMKQIVQAVRSQCTAADMT